jgi:hypothetical protein
MSRAKAKIAEIDDFDAESPPNLQDKVEELESSNNGLTEDLKRVKLLLHEVHAKVHPDDPEYQADLHARVVKEVGE